MAFYLGQALADSTKKSYKSAKRRYHSFCTVHNINPLPVCEQSLPLCSLTNEGLAHTSIKCYMSAVRHLHIEEGWGDPKLNCMPKLELVMRGIKRVQGRKQKPSPCQPITPELLRKLREMWLRPSVGGDGIMLWAAATLCFFGFLRSGEITIPSDSEFDDTAHLTFRDVAIDRLQAPSMLSVRIKASKTDPFRVGVDVVVGKVDGRCAQSQLYWDTYWPEEPGQVPLFRFEDGKPLTRIRLVEKVQRALQVAGVLSKPYSGHSFRIGAATTAARVGVEDSTIKMLGRWRSNAYQLYIRTPREQLAAVSRQLVRGSGHQQEQGHQT